MTTTASKKTLDAPVDIRFTPAGTPLAVRHDGRIWVVAAEPVRWFSRSDWWNTAKRAPVGVGNLVDIEHLQVQVRLTATSALRTFELRRDPLSEQCSWPASLTPGRPLHKTIQPKGTRIDRAGGKKEPHANPKDSSVGFFAASQMGGCKEALATLPAH